MSLQPVCLQTVFCQLFRTLTVTTIYFHVIFFSFYLLLQLIFRLWADTHIPLALQQLFVHARILFNCTCTGMCAIKPNKQINTVVPLLHNPQYIQYLSTPCNAARLGSGLFFSKYKDPNKRSQKSVASCMNSARLQQVVQLLRFWPDHFSAMVYSKN